MATPPRVSPSDVSSPPRNTKNPYIQPIHSRIPSSQSRAPVNPTSTSIQPMATRKRHGIVNPSINSNFILTPLPYPFCVITLMLLVILTS